MTVPETKDLASIDLLQKAPTMRRSYKRTLIRNGPAIALLLAVAILGLTVPHFLTTSNVINIVMQSSALGLMATGMTLVLIGGGIDLSLPSIMAFSGILGAMFMREGGNPILAALIMIIAGTLIGSINGFAVAYLNMIPFVVTLSMMAIVTGASIWITNMTSVTGVQEVFINTVLYKVWIIPVPVIFLVIVVAVANVLMRNSIYARWLYALGTNIRTSRASGIPTNRVRFGTYLLSGFFAGLAAIIITARLGSAAATMGQEGVVLDVVSSSVVGGVSIYGGVGTPLGAALGALLITLISNSMNMMHVSYYVTLVIKGLVIIAVIALDSLGRK